MQRYPGKFEDCDDDRLGAALYATDPDESTGDVCEAGLWIGLILGKQNKPSYVITEDSQGFVDYETFGTAKEARATFERLQSELASSD